MIALRRNAEYLARLFAFACAMGTWEAKAVTPLTNEAALRECERWIANHMLFLAGAYERTWSRPCL